MPGKRKLLLFDPSAVPSGWNEQMEVGEFAVHRSTFAPGEIPFCTVFGSVVEAEAFARNETAAHPALRCRIYDHQGFVGAPLQEICGAQHVAEKGITSRFRRWVGTALLGSGSVLFVADWAQDFRRTWPSVVGSRMLVPGALLLVTEALVMLNEWEKARRTVSVAAGRQTA